MPRINMTRTTIDKVPTSDRQIDYHDSKTRHLILRVRQAKVFYWYGKVDGKPRRIKLGRYPDLTPFLARKRAEEISGRVAMGEPIGFESRRAGGKTLREVHDIYLKVHARANKRPRTLQVDQGTYDRTIDHWSDRPVSELTKGDFQTLQAEVAEERGKMASNATMKLLSKILEIGRDQGVYHGPRVNDCVKRFREKKHVRYLDPDELRALLHEVDQDTHPHYPDVVRLALFTGCRKMTVMAMRWDQLKLDNGQPTLTIGDTESKNDQQTVLQLSDEAAAILKRRRTDYGGGVYVFPSSKNPKSHVSNITYWWTRIRKQAGLVNFRFHDLRHSFASWQAMAGASLPVISKTLGHASVASTARYAHIGEESARESATVAIAAMRQAVKSKSE